MRTIVATDQYLRLAEFDWVSTMFLVSGPFAARAYVEVEVQENSAPPRIQPAIVVEAAVRPIGLAGERFTVSHEPFNGVAVPIRAHLFDDQIGKLKVSSAWVVTLLPVSMEERIAAAEAFL